MSKKYSIFITALFCLFLGAFFVANAATPDRAFSPVENRTLAQRPEVTGSVSLSGVTNNILTGAFMEDFEAYVTDQFVLRDRWVALKAGAEYASGKRENNGVYICDEHTLIARFDAPTGKAAQRCEKNFGYVDAFAGVAGVPVYFSLIPGKVSVWADRLPAGAPNGDEGVYLTRGSQTAAKWLDVAAALNAHKDEAIYYRTDHHWSTLGAYYGYAALMEGMGIAPKPLSDFTPMVASNEFYGTTFSTSGVRWMEPDVMEIFVPQEAATVTNHFSAAEVVENAPLYDLSKLGEKDKYAMFLGGNKPLTVVKSNVAPAGAPRLMVVRDSFSDALAPFLAYHFSEVHLVDPRYYKTSMAQYVKDNAIDQALVLYSVDNFVSEGNLFVLGMPAK